MPVALASTSRGAPFRERRRACRTRRGSGPRRLPGVAPLLARRRCRRARGRGRQGWRIIVRSLRSSSSGAHVSLTWWEGYRDEHQVNYCQSEAYTAYRHLFPSLHPSFWIGCPPDQQHRRRTPGDRASGPWTPWTVDSWTLQFSGILWCCRRQRRSGGASRRGIRTTTRHANRANLPSTRALISCAAAPCAR